MSFHKLDIEKAALKAGISPSQLQSLMSNLDNVEELEENLDPSRFDLSRVLYYLGALIVLLAMGWFLGSSWEKFGSGRVLIIASLYSVLFLLLGHYLWSKPGTRTPAGIFVTLAVCLVPLIVYSLQNWSGWWITHNPGEYKNFFSWIRGGWFLMEVLTLLAGLLAIKFYPFPFLTMPIFFSLWFMSMDITPLLFSSSVDYWDERLWVSMIFGLLALIASYIIDLKTQKDFAFWGYLFGTLSFWMGLTLLEGSSELSQFFYLLINLGLILLSVLLQRSALLVFGVAGVLNYIISLFYRLFQNSAWFPLALSGIGLLVIFAGIQYHKNRQYIHRFMLNFLPVSAQNWLPKPKE